MKKYQFKPALAVLVAVFAFGSMLPSLASAVCSEVPQIYSPEESENCEVLIFEMNDSSNDGSDGDPDNLGTGLGFAGFGDFSGWTDDHDEGHWLIDEMINLFLVQVLPAP